MPTISELKQMQSLPLEQKIKKTQFRLKEWYEHYDGKVYLSFSGGKDSTVLRDIILNTPGITDIPFVFIDTGLEYPEVRNFAISQQGATVVKPKMNFREVIDKYGYPVVSKIVSKIIKDARSAGEQSNAYKKLYGTYLRKDGTKSLYNYKKWSYLYDAPFKISGTCCDAIKKRTGHTYQKEEDRKPITATMAEESRLRKDAWMRNGCNAFDAGNPISTPMSFWTEQDILLYIKTHNLQIPSVYGDIVETGETYTRFDKTLPELKTTGVNRTGCMFCMFGAHLEKEPNRFQQMQITHPKQWEWCMKPWDEGGLGLKDVLKYINVPWCVNKED